MQTLLIALGAGVAFMVAYHTYGRWIGRRVFELSASAVCPSEELRDGRDFVPTPKAVVFGHHFTSIAGTGPIVGPAIAVMWGWVPALLWVVLGSIFIGAVHDFASLVVSLRSKGRTVGDIAGDVLNRRVRLLFLFVLFMALTIVLAIFGLVIAAVFRQYPAAITPCLVQVPLAVAIGVVLHRRGQSLVVPSLVALAVMYLTVIYGDVGVLGGLNERLAGLPVIVWVAGLLLYSYAASVLPVWTLLQPRDFINSLQLLTALGLIVAGLVVAAFTGGEPPVPGAPRQPLEIVAPAFNPAPEGAPPLYPFLFITIACGAISGFHCLVSSGTSSKQLRRETDARFVGYGGMVTEGFLATLVILCCVAGLGLGVGGQVAEMGPPRSESNGGVGGTTYAITMDQQGWTEVDQSVAPSEGQYYRIDEPNQDGDFDAVHVLVGEFAWSIQYASWQAAGGLAAKVGAFVKGAANFLVVLGLPVSVAVALMGVLVASFAGTTLDTACRLQRYVVQELAGTLLPRRRASDCAACGYDLTGNVSGVCPECGAVVGAGAGGASPAAGGLAPPAHGVAWWNPLRWLNNAHGAALFAVLVAAGMACVPAPGSDWSIAGAGQGGLILWPMFGATNQLLGGLAFLVVAFWLRRRGKPVWFVLLPLGFMLAMPAWAMAVQLPEWVNADEPNWVLIGIAGATLALEAWMVVEAVRLWPGARGSGSISGGIGPIDS
ncbi:MAG: carbon starvation protein A [Planctomycetota bacterium]